MAKRTVSSAGVQVDVDALARLRDVATLIAPTKGGARRWLAIQVVLNVLSMAAGLAMPALVGVAVNQAVEGHLGWGFWALAAAMALSSLLAAATGPVAARFGVAVGSRLTYRIAKHALDLGLPGRRPFDDGDLLNRIATEAPSLPGFADALLRVGRNAVMAVGCLLALLFWHWLLVPVWFAGVALAALLVHRLTGELAVGQTAYSELHGRMATRFTDALAGRRTVRASGTLEREVGRIAEPLPALAAQARGIIRDLGRGAALFQFADYGILVATAVTGIWLLGRGELDIGGLLATIRYAQMATENVSMAYADGFFQTAILRARATRVKAVLDAPAATPPPASPACIPDAPRDIHLRDVTVAGGGAELLRDVQLRVGPGTTLAVVGKSGVGKTTLTALVGRLYDPDRGAIAVAGTPVTHWAPDALASTVAYAFEKPALPGDTIRDTIALGADVSEAALRSAARLAEADAFISRLPQAYDTPVAQAPMSGGERQRLGLARAALRDGAVLILDDALSSLDMATEARVAAALGALGTQRTTILVAHRASTAASADLVAWLVDGEIRRVAPHAELWRDPGSRAAFATDGRTS